MYTYTVNPELTWLLSGGNQSYIFRKSNNTTEREKGLNNIHNVIKLTH